jgi:nickel-dependent lactate racemase
MTRRVGVADMTEVVKWAETQDNPLINQKCAALLKAYDDLVMVCKLSSDKPLTETILPNTRYGVLQALNRAREANDDRMVTVLKGIWARLDR